MAKTCFRVSLTKVEFTEEFFSLHPTPTDGLAAVGEIEKEMGLDRGIDFRATVNRSPVTGEYFMTEMVEVECG